MIGDILQPTHLLFILVIALLVLGPKRLPEVGRSLGRGLRDFRLAISGEEPDRHQEVVSPATSMTTAAPMAPAATVAADPLAQAAPMAPAATVTADPVAQAAPVAQAVPAAPMAEAVPVAAAAPVAPIARAASVAQAAPITPAARPLDSPATPVDATVADDSAEPLAEQTEHAG